MFSDQRSAISDQRSASSDQRAAISDQRSASSEQRAAIRIYKNLRMEKMLILALYIKGHVMQRVRNGFFRELRVYQNSMEAASEVFQIVGKLPATERFTLIDQMKRASQSICANLAEAWRLRRYKKAFIAKLNTCEAEATGMRVWLELSFRFRYLDNEIFSNLDDQYDHIIAQLVTMIRDADKWVISPMKGEK